MVNNVLAVIPARSGSKRIPGKNIVEFCGKPMLVWTLDAAVQSSLFSRIIVSTDSENIAEVARSAGAEVPFLRSSHADDHAPVSQASIAALDQCRKFYGEDYEHVVQLMPNCPLRRASHIVDAFQHYAAHEYRPQISCFRYGWMNPWWAVTLDSDLRPTRLFPQTSSRRSQDLPPLFCPSGAIWIAPAKDLKRSGTFYADRHIFYEMNWESAIDIDDDHDLEMARILYRTRFQNIDESSI